jgi:hypothetical protein
MTVEQDTTQRYGTDDTEPSIEDLTCAARDVQRQAEVVQEVRPQLDTFRDQYATARTAYAAVFETATVDVGKAETRLAQLQPDIDCKVSQEDRDRLEELWTRVQGDMQEDRCLPEPGCRVEPCSPDSSVDDDEEPAELAGRIIALRQEAADRAAEFEDLVAEQTDLPVRASRAVQVVEQLAAELRAEPQDDDKTPDQQRLRNAGLYARSLVARWQLSSVTERRFATVAVYTTCLQTSLSCLLRVWQAIATLEGASARKACQEEQRAARCSTLLADPAAEVISRWRAEPGGGYAAEAGAEAGPE